MHVILPQSGCTAIATTAHSSTAPATGSKNQSRKHCLKWMHLALGTYRQGKVPRRILGLTIVTLHKCHNRFKVHGQWALVWVSEGVCAQCTWHCNVFPVTGLIDD